MHQLLIIWISGFCGSFQSFCHVRVPCEVLDLHNHLRVCFDRFVTKVVNVECPEINIFAMLVRATYCPTCTHSQTNRAKTLFGLNIDNLASGLSLLHMTWIIGCSQTPTCMCVWCE